jgi:NAD(P)-dependent dehydrogenase (short-subunit alcohol dehydrogenase family)
MSGKIALVTGAGPGLGASLGYLGGPGRAEHVVNHLELVTERGGA